MKHQHSFRQSWLNEAANCPERARRTLAGTLPARETDAAAIGTGVHAGIEAFLRGDITDYKQAVDLACDTFNEIEQHPAFIWSKYSHRTAQDRITTYLAHWWGIRDQFDPIDVEWTFNKTIYEDDERVINLTGTVDLIDKRLGLVDWKTSGRGPYETWEYDRWAIQPTVYTWAHHDDTHEQHPFTYTVMHKDGVQQFTVWRSQRDWNWLTQRALQYARMIEANLDEWPMHDNTALCSAKWCPAWDTCKGAYFYA
jgi:hypothetical protein